MLWNSQWQSAQLRALYTEKTKVNTSVFIYRSLPYGNFPHSSELTLHLF